MAKQLYCPHYVSYGGTMRGCTNGHFPCNCETCDCPDKQWYEAKTTTATTLVDDVGQTSDVSTIFYGLTGSIKKEEPR